MVNPRNHRSHIRNEKLISIEDNRLNVMTKESVEQFLEQSQQKICARILEIQSGILHYLYEYLPEGEKLYKSTLEGWRETLKTKEYAVSTINSFIFVANRYMEFVGHREYQLLSRLKKIQDAILLSLHEKNICSCCEPQESGGKNTSIL